MHMSRTLFYAKKIVAREHGWTLGINLVFEGREFSMTDIPIQIDERDVGILCPGADTDSGDRFTDTVAIESPHQFESIFGADLADWVPDLLCDVYNGRSWKAKIVDIDGNEIVIDSYLTEEFVSRMTEVLRDSDRLWMEIRVGSTRFNKDWSISIEDETAVFNNIRDGFRPIGASQAQTIIDSLVPLRIFSDREDFKGTVMKSGNSLVLKVTDQCRRMGIEVGDEVSVTLDMNSPGDNTELRVFAARNWTPITDMDALCHRDGCDLGLVRRFIDDFRIIGTLEPHLFKPAMPQFDRMRIFDHLDFFKDENGQNLLVSQPYSKGPKLKDAEEWARRNGCTAEEHREYSWHHPPETTLLVFRRKVNPDWKMPEIKDVRRL